MKRARDNLKPVLELKTQTHREKIDLDPEISRKFKDPIIFYMRHKDDQKCFFVTFVILDLQKKEITYISTYSPENREKVENHEKNEIFKSVPYLDPHCSIKIDNQGEFLTFVEGAGFFYQVKPKEDKVIIQTGDDLNIKQPAFIKRFGATCSKIKEGDKELIYFTAISSQKDGAYCVNFYRSSLDLRHVQIVFSIPADCFSDAPHETKKFGKFLFNSEFSVWECQNKKTGEIFKREVELYRYVYRELFKEFCEASGEKFSEESFLEKNKFNWKGATLEPKFREFCESRGKNFLDICSQDSRFDFAVQPGKVSLINLENQTVDFYQTTCCRPAHFRIDEHEGFIYTSSHNFTRFGQLYYLGPAAIDKFRLKGGKLEKLGTFSDPTAYRLTTHKVFHYQGKSYICSFGQPNRLFFIDAQAMTTLFYEDIGEDVLSRESDVRDFLNNTNLNPACFTAIEVSDDGEILFLLDYQYIYFYSFPERRILTRLPYFGEHTIHSFLAGFYKSTTHCDYLR